MLENTVKLLLLVFDAIIGEDFRRSEVRKSTLAFEMRASSERSSEAGHVGRRKSQPVHARLKLHVEFEPASRSSRGAFQKAQLLAARDRRSQIVLDQVLLFAGPKAGEHKNRLADLAVAQFDSLGRASYAKPVRAGSGQGARHGHSAMAVSVGLHNGQDFSRWPRGRASLARVDMAPNRSNVVRERAEPDFCPDRTAIESNASLHGGRSQTKPKSHGEQNARHCAATLQLTPKFRADPVLGLPTPLNPSAAFLLNPITNAPLGATDQRSQIKTFNIAPTWTRLTGTDTVSTFGDFLCEDQYNYCSSGDPFSDFSPDPQAETFSQSRSPKKSRAARGCVPRGIHKIKVGALLEHWFLTESDSLGIVDPGFLAGLGCPDPTILACVDLARYDLAAAGESLFNFRCHADMREETLAFAAEGSQLRACGREKRFVPHLGAQED